MIKWLKKFKRLKPNVLKHAKFCFEMRVDKHGLVYYPANLDLVTLDPAIYSQMCQIAANLALLEMRNVSRVLH